MTEEAQRIQRIISKHVHDVRNNMNCVYWEAVLLGELSTEPEVPKAVQRMCAELKELEVSLRALVYKFSEPAPLTFSSVDLLHLWQQEIAPLETPDRQVIWSPPTVAHDIVLDAHAMLSVLRELVIAAWGRAPASVLKAAVVIMDQCAALELREPVSSTPPEAEALKEQQRFVAIHGGTLAVSEDRHAGERIISLSFALLQPKAGK